MGGGNLHEAGSRRLELTACGRHRLVAEALRPRRRHAGLLSDPMRAGSRRTAAEMSAITGTEKRRVSATAVCPCGSPPMEHGLCTVAFDAAPHGLRQRLFERQRIGRQRARIACRHQHLRQRLLTDLKLGKRVADKCRFEIPSEELPRKFFMPVPARLQRTRSSEMRVQPFFVASSPIDGISGQITIRSTSSSDT